MSAVRSRLSGRWLGLGPPVRAGMGDVSAAAIAVERWQKWGMPKAVEVQDCVRSSLSGRWQACMAPDKVSAAKPRV